ncbi:MAG: DUF5916 domain-containing protein [Saprospiraceae bacterium]
MKLTLTLLLAVFVLQLFAQEGDNVFPPPTVAPIITALETRNQIQVDGKLNESDWNQAPIVSDFFKIEPRQGGDYLYDTEVKLLYDERNLYIGVFCRDSLGRKGVRVQDLRRDFSWGENDIFGIQLDPQNLKQYCVSFQTTPYGNQRDLQAFNDENRDNDWNALWSVRTVQTDTGYYAEFAIPFKSLRYEVPANADSVAWGITFTRLARRDYEQTVFPAIPQAFSPYRMTYAATLKGIKLPQPSANVRIEPYALYQYDENKSNGQTTDKSNFKLGGDVKWAINPRAVLDLTINTDFAQADVDRAVNNLERFNVFFPERRQFFLENSGIWAGAGDETVVPFFSRRIGLQGEFNAAPAPIDAGVRFTDRNENRTLAGLYIHQRETDQSAGANFGVLRYLQNYGSQNNVGVMLTHRLDENFDEQGQAQRNNTTLSIDGLFRPRDELTVSYLLSASRDNSNDTLGVAGRLFAGYNTNKMYLGWLTNFVSEQYIPGMGFIFQNNVIQHNPGGYAIIRPKKLPWVRRYDPGLFVNYYHDFENPGQFQQANLYLFPVYLIFTNGSFLEWALFPTWQNINFNFAPLGIEIEQQRYFYLTQYIRFNTDQSKKWSASIRYDWGDYYNGKRDAITAGFRLAPDPRVAFTLDYEYNHLQNLGLRRQNLETNLITGGLRLAWNPRLQLSAFYQYNSFDNQGRWNIRGSWEYRPLSFVYLVFNENNLPDFDTRNRSTIAKVSFLKQF